MPKKKYNVILDLDNTLICAQHSKSKREPDFEIKVGNEHYYVYKRPGLDRFLNEIFDCSKSVSIWTAATKDYCNQIVKNIFTVWIFSMGLKSAIQVGHPSYYKPAKWL